MSQSDPTAGDNTSRLLVALMLGAPLLLGGCGTAYRAKPPSGFARLEQEGPFRALTPDRVIYRVRQAPNEPRADLTFWQKALKQRMTDAGYLFVAEREIKASGVPGYLIELAAPFGQEDYSYLIALFVRDDRLVIAEATGEVSRLTKRRPAILSAIEGLQW